MHPSSILGQASKFPLEFDLSARTGWATAFPVGSMMRILQDFPQGRRRNRSTPWRPYSRASSDVRTLSIILAATDVRARILVRRELLDDKDALSVGVCEGDKLLWTEWP